jgi:tripartite-type tricarboxylate transporter receptor subunit TctC
MGLRQDNEDDMRISRLGLLVLALAAVAPVGATAQNYPDRTVRVIVPYTPGGGTDTVARAISQRLSAKWGQPVIVENRPGAGTSLGADAVAKSVPDGYTLLFTDSASFVINPHIYAKLPLDPLKDLEPIALAVRLAPVLAVANDAPGNTIPELIAYGKANPGVMTYATPGVGSYTHVAMEYFKHLAGVDILHVPYRGSTPALTDLLGGRVTMYMVTYSVFDALEREGKLKIAAAATDERLPNRPDLPTIGETVKGYGINVWFGFAAPATTPALLLDKVHSDVAAILKEPEFIDTFIKPQAYIAGDLSRREFAEQIKAEHAKWGELVKISGVPAQ